MRPLKRSRTSGQEPWLLENGEALRPLILFLATSCLQDLFFEQTVLFLALTGSLNMMSSVAQSLGNPTANIVGHLICVGALFLLQLILGLELIHCQLALTVAMNICPLIIRDIEG